jgi:hypothetical protein
MADVYWSPSKDSPVLGVIKMREPRELTGQLYLEFLASRVQEMINREDDPEAAVQNLQYALEELGLDPGPPNPEMPAESMLASTQDLLEVISLKGIALEPGVKTSNQPGMKRVYEETDLYEWLESLS